VTNGLTMLRLLPTSDRTKDVEILALRHQITVLERQLHRHGHRVRFAPADRALLAALLHRLPRQTLHQIRLVVRPDTILRWHRDLMAAHHARISRPRRIGRPRACGQFDNWSCASPGRTAPGLPAHPEHRPPRLLHEEADSLRS
jgi:putative transposase